jgi:myo-inositol-1(or 4)-monophosphatase
MKTVERELRDAYRLAHRIAREAGRLLRERRDSSFGVSKKGRVNLVTEVDLAAEELIVGRIRDRFPSHAILAEEGGTADGTSSIRWVIDPLDGTTNYAHGYPLYCVSIGLELAGELVAGVVYNPVNRELFTAYKGGGARLNGRPISVSGQESLVDSLLCTGFSYQREEIGRNLRFFNRVMDSARSVRRDGSAALDLCFVACGRFEGFWELSLHPWDVAAGSLIVREAGGSVTRFDGSPVGIYDPECLATNGRIHDAMVEILGNDPSAGSEEGGAGGQEGGDAR